MSVSSSPRQLRLIIEGAPPTSGPTLRIALEVDDTAEAVRESANAGATLLAPPVGRIRPEVAGSPSP